MRTIVIDRKKWLRGESKSYLLREYDNKMCCLGFYLNQCGILPAYLINIYTPDGLEKNLPEESCWLLNPQQQDSLDAEALMNINDSIVIKDSEKERKITEIFKNHTVEVKFR